MSLPSFSPTTERLFDSLPEVQRREDERQPYPSGSGPFEAAVNYVKAPKGDNLTGWSANGAISTISVDAGRIKLVFNGAAGVPQLVVSSDEMPVSLGDVGYLSLKYQGPGGRVVVIHHRDAADTILAQTTPTLPDTAGQEITFWFRVPAITDPATTHLFLAQLAYNGAPLPAPNGETHYFRDVLFTKTTAETGGPAYFDGDTTNVYTPDLWSWNGTPNLSTSTQEARERDPGGYPLKRYLSGTGDQLGEVDDLVLRADYYTVSDGVVGDTSEIVDPTVADVAWLPWIGQLVGVRVDPAAPEMQQRDQASGAAAGFKAGSRPALAAAVSTFLTGAKQVAIYTHSTDANPGGVGTGTQWEVLIVTRATETPITGAQLIAGVIALGAKPAGLKLYHRTLEATWDTLEAAYPEWTGWEKPFIELEETGL